MAKVIWSPSALDDVDRIAEYIARDKPDAAYRWVEKIEATCELLFGATKSNTVRIDPQKADANSVALQVRRRLLVDEQQDDQRNAGQDHRDGEHDAEDRVHQLFRQQKDRGHPKDDRGQREDHDNQADGQVLPGRRDRENVGHDISQQGENDPPLVLGDKTDGLPPWLGGFVSRRLVRGIAHRFSFL